jgi:Putative MetA-pathway of phenol degradation
MEKLLWLPLAMALALAIPVPVSAQSTDAGLANLVPDLILRGITLPGGSDPGTPHGGHFTLGDPTAGGSQAASLADADTVRAVAAFSDRLRSQFAIFPLGSSTGGFTFSFDEGTLIYTRSRESFGPAFVERAATIGRKKLSVGFGYQHSRFDEFAGQELGDGTIKFFLPHTDCCSGAVPPPSEDIPGMESDIMQVDLLLNATTDTFAAFVNYGVTDHLDIGVAIPFTRVDLEANLHAHILRLSTVDNSRVHTFVQNDDVSEKIFTKSGSATGIGDIVFRSKYNFLHGDKVDVAAALDLRLPTGDENELLGVGTTQAKFFAILSSTRGRLSPHVNLGFTISGKGSQDLLYGIEPLGVSDEFNYAGGVEYVAHPRLTLLADFIGRTLFDAGNIELESRTFTFRVGAAAGATTPQQTSSTNPITGEPYRQLALRSGNLSQLLGATGFKFNVASNLLVMAHVLFPFNDAGLTDRMTLAFGVDYAF